MRVVLDTNVLVSSYLNASGPPSQIRTAFRDRQFDVVVSEALLDEYSRVLAYERIAKLHGLSQAEIAEEIVGFAAASILVTPAEIPNLIPEDPADNVVVGTAVAGEATYIVSGDDDLHRLGSFAGIRVLSPAVFLAYLQH